jgi:endonuclease/exonuclease/phosphatase family metal-dependent hydrolase
MTIIVTWNIQAGLGCDGVTDLGRIADTIRVRDPDIVCLQEVAQNVPEMAGGEDQLERLAGLFAGYHAVFGAAIDRANISGAGSPARARFGNLILSRLPVIQLFAHPLPQPAAAGVRHMPRQATEIVAETAAGPVRVVTMHLEYHSVTQRIAQAQYLTALQAEVEANAAAPGHDGGQGIYALASRPASALYCGDFNAGPGDAVHALMTAPLASGRALQDAWTVFAGHAPHPPTTGVFDRAQWPQGPHCRDYFFVTQDIARRIEEVEVDLETDQSDHQPVILRLR